MQVLTREEGLSSPSMGIIVSHIIDVKNTSYITRYLVYILHIPRLVHIVLYISKYSC